MGPSRRARDKLLARMARIQGQRSTDTRLDGDGFGLSLMGFGFQVTGKNHRPGAWLADGRRGLHGDDGGWGNGSGIYCAGN